MSKPVQVGDVYISHETKDIPLLTNLKGVSFYQECAIENKTGRTIYVMKCDGSIASIPSLSSRTFDPVLIIKVLTRDVEVDKNGFMRDVSDPGRRNVDAYMVKLQDFTERPLFIRELGVVISVRCDPEEMGRYHPCADSYYNVRFSEVLNASINGQRNNPLRFFINTYDESINTFYVVINGLVLGCDVCHIPHMREGIWLTMRFVKSRADVDPDVDDALRTYSLTDDVFRKHDLRCFEFAVDNVSWTVGTDRVAVVKAAKEHAALLDKSYTQQEIDDKVAEGILAQSKIAEDYKQQLEDVKKEMKTKENKIKILEEEASQADRQLKSELERIRLQADREKFLTESLKQEAERERLAMANQNERLRLELEQLKASVEREKVSTEFSRQDVEREKLNVERYKIDESSAQYKADTVASYVKAASVIAPAALTLGTLAARSLGKGSLIGMGAALALAGYQLYQTQKTKPKQRGSSGSGFFINVGK